MKNFVLRFMIVSTMFVSLSSFANNGSVQQIMEMLKKQEEQDKKLEELQQTTNGLQAENSELKDQVKECKEKHSNLPNIAKLLKDQKISKETIEKLREESNSKYTGGQIVGAALVVGLIGGFVGYMANLLKKK